MNQSIYQMAWSGALSALVATGVGCGSIDCSETATCSDPAADATAYEGHGGSHVNVQNDVDASDGGSPAAVGVSVPDATIGGDDGSASGPVATLQDNGTAVEANADATDGPAEAVATGAPPAMADAPMDVTPNVPNQASADEGGAVKTQPGDSGPEAGARAVPDAGGDAPSGCGSVEDCMNGIDDNCDGKIDCADPQCMPDYTCTPAVPPSWTGPVAVAVVNQPKPLPGCPATYPTAAYSGHANVWAPPSKCQCVCDGPCSLQVTTYSNDSCGGAHACGPPTTVGAGCSPASDACAAQTAKITGGPAFSGCSSSVQATPSPYAWGTATVACAANNHPANNQGGCGEGQLCVAAPPAAFGAGLCVYAPGHSTCPAAGYSFAHVYFEGATDSRDCDGTGCQCSWPPPFGYCSTSGVTLSSGPDCDGGVALGGSCGEPFTATSSPYVATTLWYSAGSCTPTGFASPTGSVTPTTPTTLCCTK